MLCLYIFVATYQGKLPLLKKHVSFIFLLLSIRAHAQRQGALYIDSLQQQLNAHHQLDTVRVRLLDNLSYAYAVVKPDEGIRIGQEVVRLSEQLHFGNGVAAGYAAQGINYAAKGSFQQALDYYQKAVAIYEKEHNLRGVAGVKGNIGVVYLNRTDYPGALSYFMEALRVYEELKDDNNIAHVSGNIGNIYLEQKKFDEAKRYFHKSLSIYERTGDVSGKVRMYGNLGIIFDELGNHAEALGMHRNAAAINTQIGNKRGLQINMANIGLIYCHLKRYDEALAFQNKALELSNELVNQSSKAIDLGNIGETYYKIAGDFDSLKLRGVSLPAGRKEALANAISYLGKAIGLCRELQFNGPLVEFNEYLSNAYYLAGNYKAAYETLKISEQLKNEIYTEQKDLELADLETRRAIELKDKDIEIKSKQLMIERLEAAKRRSRNGAYILGIVLLLIVVVFILRRLNYFRRSSKQLTAEKSEVVELLQEAQRLAKFGNWNVDMQKGEVYWSEGIRYIYGVKEDLEPGFETFLNMLHPDERMDIERRILNAQADGTPLEFTHRIIRPDGDVRILNSLTRFELNEKGLPTRIFGVSQDITELMQARNTQERAEANMRTVLDNSDTAYVLINADYHIVTFNEPAQQFAREELKTTLFEGKKAEDCFGVERWTFVNAILSDVVRGNYRSYEVKYSQPDHTEKWYYARYFPVAHNDGKIYGVILAISDITERKISEQRTLELVDNLQKRNNDLSQFAYIVSHNLRSPIAKLIGLMDVLRQEAGSDNLLAQTAWYAEREVSNLDKIIEDLNVIITVRDAGNSTREEIDLPLMIGQITESLGSDPELNMRLNASLNIRTIFTVRGYLYSILHNLISNAIKYRSPDRPLELTIASSEQEQYICIQVKDNGQGIDLEHNRDKIFGLYKRFHGQHIPGRGLGLYMAKTQVETLGGKIVVESVLGEGSVFYIYLPKV